MNITVYGAASNTIAPEYFQAAETLGAEIAKAGAAVVNGGGKMGLMGASIDGALKAGGTAIGVLPEFMAARGWGHPGLTRTEIVAGMRERKAMMMELADGIIAMPGGIGTFEEIFEALTQKQLGLWHGNIVFYNTLGFWNPIIEMMRNATAGHFMRQDHFDLLFTVTDDPAEAVRTALTPPIEHDFTRKF